jgi:hypothetical protein
VCSLDLGGAESKDPGPDVRNLKEICEAAGWRVNVSNSGKKKTRFSPPNLEAVLELCAVDEVVNELCPGIAELAKSIKSSTNSKPRDMSLPAGMEWQEIQVTVDSGACDHVCNPEEVDPKEIRETEAVRRGVTYTCASGKSILNEGEVKIDGITPQGQELSLTMQVAGVKKPLASVRKMTKAGNRVVFEEISDTCGGYVENKESGVKVPISKEGPNGTYKVSLWRPRKVRAKSGRFAALDEDIDGLSEDEHVVEGANSSSSFHRHA